MALVLLVVATTSPLGFDSAAFTLAAFFIAGIGDPPVEFLRPFAPNGGAAAPPAAVELTIAVLLRLLAKIAIF